MHANRLSEAQFPLRKCTPPETKGSASSDNAPITKRAVPWHALQLRSECREGMRQHDSQNARS